MTRARLIVLEGPEGVGKTTQIGLLIGAFAEAGVSAVTFREPGGTPTGDAIRALLLDPDSELGAASEALLFMASRAELCTREIVPALEAGVTVVLDRFFLSTYAYQIFGRGLSEDAVRAANRLATGGLVPDLTLLLDLPLREGLGRAAERGTRDRIERSTDDFHQRVAAAFQRFATSEWVGAHPECGSIVSIDASGPADVVFGRVTDALAARFPAEFGSLASASAPTTVHASNRTRR